ncbi:MAG: guanine deaminase [Deltaproteobacteria bacterium]|nr:guanine deaminase [Deltaproteobacteria bacterium]
MAPRLASVRGRLLAPDPQERTLVEWPDAVVEIDDDGRIRTVCEAAPDCTIPETWPGAVLLPGLVDTHLHFPQTRVIGSASGPLLPWLQRSVFPEEARFSDTEYAVAVAGEFCRSLVEQGTTLAGVYSSAHPEATEVLLEALQRSGLRATAGLTLMDRNAPDAVRLDAPTALRACATLIERWHGVDGGRIQFSMIPRFAINCTPELLRGAGQLSEAHDLLLQTHISENLDEVEQTAALFPDSRDYLGVYEDHDCAGPRSLLAHCIHLSEDEWSRIHARDIAIAHCPDSNFFLGSGCMPLRRALEQGIRVGLGTDVGAGRTFSVRRVAASAYDASLIRGAPVDPQQLLWLATRGGSRAMRQDDRLGCIAPGFEADLVAIDVPNLPFGPLIDALLFRHDAGPVRATVVGGHVLHETNPR